MSTLKFVLPACLLLSGVWSAAGQCPVGTTVQVINNAGNNANGSLAWAIDCLNTVPSLTTLTFSIPGSTVIQPSVALTVSKSGALIDGNSQPGIVIDGTAPAGPPPDGLTLFGQNITVQGLTIRNFTNPAGGIGILANGNNPTIQNNTLIANRIGISTGSIASNFTITGNVVGASGTGNSAGGIQINGAPGAGVISFNEIAHNIGAGVSILGGTVRIQENSMYCNSDAGITRPTPPVPPVITQASTQQIRGTSAAGAIVEVFTHSNTGCSAAPCQGKTYLGTVTANAVGVWTLMSGAPAGSQVTATSTQANNTSAFSTCAAVIDCSALTASINQTNVSCFGGSNGAATALPSGSTILYAWNTGATTASISNLSAGNYTVTVTNATNGCTDSETATITQPTALAITTAPVNVSCFGGANGAVTATAAGGITPYTFAWNTGANTATINNLAAGVYTVTVTDGNNCTVSQTVTVGQPTALVAAVTPTNVSCFGGANGAATANASGGTTPYTFAWNTGANTATINNLAAGVYTVTVTDGNNCTVSQTATVGQPTALVATATPVNVSCFGGANGAATANATGGITPYTFAWNTGANTATINNLAAGVYTVTVTDGNNCTVSQTATVGQPTALVATATPVNVSCFGGANGAATANATGGITPYTFAWNTGANTATINNLAAGVYTVTVTDGNNCTVSQTATVGQPTALVATATPVNVSCFGGANGAATANATGGITPYTFAWNTGANTATINNLAAGVYTVTVSDGNNCTVSQTATVGQPTALVATATPVNVSCFGGANGAATANATGGITPYTFAWNTGANTATINNLAAGVYTVTVSDGNNCTVSQTATVGQSTALVATATPVNVSCFGGANGAATANATGGTTPYTFAWNTGANTGTINNLAAGVYTVTVTDGNNCTVSQTATVGQPTALVATATPVNVSCFGGANGAATANATGGTTPYTFVWNTGATTATINNLAAGVYTVTVTDGNNCIVSQTATVGQPTALVATATPVNVSCFGGANGAATANATGGITPYTFAWNTGANTATINNLAAGVYTVTVTDGNNCTVLQTATVGQPAALVATATPVNVSCFGGTNGAATATATGGATPYTFAWNTGANTGTINNLAAGVYTVTVSDGNNCTVSQTATVGQPTALVATATPVNVSCFGGANGAATANATGGTTPYTFVWNTGATTATINNLAAGVYTVTVTDGNNCIVSQTATVGQPTALVATATPVNVSCFGGANGAATATATGGTTPYTFVWNTGATTATINNLAAGVYTVTVTDGNNCTVSQTATVGQPTALVATATPVNVSCFGGANGAATANATGGTTPYTFVWNTGATTATINNLAAGVYTVTVTDGNNCTVSQTATVGQPTALVATATPINVSCFGGTNGAAAANATGGTTPYTFVWNTGATTATINNLAAGVYTVTVTDGNNCTVSQTATVNQPPVLNLTLNSTDESAVNANDGTAQAIPDGGTPAYTYAWSNGANTDLITDLAPGVYTVTVTDALGCTIQDFVTINSFFCSGLTVATSATNVACNGGANGSATATPGGGVSPFIYAWSNGGVTPAIQNLPTGTYTVTLTAGNGCTATGTVDIGQPPALAANSGTVNVSCFGGTNGAAAANATGGITPYNFAWNTGANTATINNLAASVYTVTVSDGNNCTVSQTATVGQPTALSATATPANVSCFGGTNGAATANATGGATPYTFAWNTGANTATINNLTASVYTVTVTDGNNCTVSQTATVGQPTALSATATPVNVSCFGGTNGAVAANAAGGTTPYNFAWNTGANTSTIGNLAAGVYTVTVSDGNNCTVSQTATIGQPPALSLTFTSTDESAVNANDGTAQAIPGGGTPAYTYAWSNGANTALITNLAPGVYTVTITDALGCTIQDFVTVNSFFCSGLTVATSATNVACNGGANGSAIATPGGGVAPFIYAWSNGGVTPAIQNLSTGTYTVTLTAGNGCTTTGTVDIGQPSALVANTSTVNVGCFGGANGTATANATGGTTPYTFAWNTGANTATINNLAAGVYTVTVTDGNNCSVSQTATIGQPSALSLALNSTDESAVNANDGTAQAIPGGGTPAYTYAWSNGANTALITNLAPGVYTVTVTDALGCTIQDFVTVNSFFCSGLTVVTSATNVACNGGANGSAAATPGGGVAPFIYAWSNGSVTPAIQNLPTGTYTVTLTAGNGCTATGTVDIGQPPALAANTSTVNVSCFGGANGAAVANAAGGTTPYNFAWNTGANTSTIGNLAAGVYTVTVSDGNNCTISQTATVNQAPALALNASATATSAPGANDGIASASANGGTPPLTFFWNTGATTPQITGLPPGNYSVTVTDMQGCTTSSSVTVVSGGPGGPCKALPVYALYAPDEVCGNTPFRLDADDLYPHTDVQYRWWLPNGDTLTTDAPLLDLVATSTAFSGDYYVQRDSAGCLSTPVGGAPVTVLSLAPGAVDAGTDTVVCAAGLVVLLAKPLLQGTGTWVALNGAEVDDPAKNPTAARNLQPGVNSFVWKVSLGACPDAGTDTIRYFLENRPVATDDKYTILRAGEQAVMEVLLNDALGGLPDTVLTLLDSVGSGGLAYWPDTRRFYYDSEKGFRGTVQFRYTVCSPASVCAFPCDTALVTIDVQNMPSVQEALVLGDPGANGRLEIGGVEGFDRVEISIFDRWGSLVFQDADYDNGEPWLGEYKGGGRYLPKGAYFYFLNAYDGNNPVGGTLTGAIYLFENE